MKFMDTFLPEFDYEMQNTRSIIALVPDNLLSWKAEESLNSVGWVASHLADTLSWVEVTLKEISFDIAPIDGPPHETPILVSTSEILTAFDENLATARAFMAEATDEQLQVLWTLLQGGKELFTMPRAALVRNLFMNHMIHHRAFLISYLRINKIQCPPMYG